MKIAIAQINPTVGDLKGNSELIKKQYQESVSAGVELVVTPELSLTGYPPRDLLDRSYFTKACAEAAEELASITQDAMLIFGAPIPEGKALYNCAIAARNGKICLIQKKALLPFYDVFDESRYFEAATDQSILDFKGEKLGIMICEDSWHIPGVTETARYTFDPVERLCEKGATFLINISASPFQLERTKLRRSIGTYHSAKHNLPFLLVNQIGGNDELLFDGSSYYISNNGEEIRCTSFKEELLIFDTNNIEKQSFSPEEELSNLYQALVMGIQDYARKCGFKKAIIGLSGGIDSALTAALACAALGAENVTGITMPSQYSSSGSVDDSVQLAANLGMPFHKIAIKPIFDSFCDSLTEIFKDTESGVAEENLQARTRGSLLMAVSNKYGKLLLSTGNKSELSMGYCTLYGDMNGGLSVLGDVLKTKVYDLSNFINREKEIIPNNTITKAPSAELRPDQKDSDSLPPYEILDDILQQYLEQGVSRVDIIASGHDKELVEKILRAVDLNEYKRRQSPPVLRISGKAFGTGRRMPIAAKIG